MKIKGILVTAATIGAAAALTFGGLALAEQGSTVEPSPSPTPSVTPTATPTPAPSVEPTPAAPAPAVETAPAPAPAPTPAPQSNSIAEPEQPAPAINEWPHYVAVTPQPPVPAGMEGYQQTADGIWFKGCGEADTSCAWTYVAN